MTCLDGNLTHAANGTYGLDVSRASFDGVMIFLVMVTNAAILAVVARRWCTEGIPLGNVTSSILVINLSAADFLVGLFSIYYFLPRYCCGLAEVLAQSKNLCILRFALIVMAHLGSGYTLMAIAADRYVAVCHAINYRDVITPRRSVCVIVVIWILALSGSMVLFAWNKWNGVECSEWKTLHLWYIVVVGLFGQFVILGTITAAHWKVHRTVMELRQRATQSASRTSNVLTGGVSGGMFAQDDRVGTRAARVLALILGVYVASWGPFMIVLVLQTAGLNVPMIVMETVSSLVNFNYLVNPFIYAYNNRPIQKAIRKCISSLKRKTFDSWNEPSNSLSLSRH